ncbi:DUF1476 domain-containing protein [Roseobacter sp. HKCCA0434]|uniref:DUF1476 domain-containing protein n=1 Tax=Roseobacter sp. HKCCA0434 TaxID=3079297 RepID=UPI002905E7CB|nr:DUF1476 domain-containing protein [Roseobacter sp. HKCCA0434]
MPTFDDRKKSFEAKFAHDSEMLFKAEMRRNKILALWAAGLMDYEPDRSAAYVKDVIKADFAEAGDEDVYRKLKEDLGDRVSEADLRAKMAQSDIEAKAQLVAES